jgi:hypothetical protein
MTALFIFTSLFVMHEDFAIIAIAKASIPNGKRRQKIEKGQNRKGFLR